jgi:hypothetical protein
VLYGFETSVVNERKRKDYSRKLQTALTEILNDELVMPNIDAADLIVTVASVWFGKTVRDINIGVFGRAKCEQSSQSLHEEYVLQTEQNGNSTYIDLTDLTVYPEFMSAVAIELQKRCNLQYTPSLNIYAESVG